MHHSWIPVWRPGIGDLLLDRQSSQAGTTHRPLYANHVHTCSLIVAQLKCAVANTFHCGRLLSLSPQHPGGWNSSSLALESDQHRVTLRLWPADNFSYIPLDVHHKGEYRGRNNFLRTRSGRKNDFYLLGSHKTLISQRIWRMCTKCEINRFCSITNAFVDLDRKKKFIYEWLGKVSLE